MISQDTDALVLAKLRGNGPGTFTVRQLAETAGLPRVTLRTSVAALAVDGLVCLIESPDKGTYMIRHLHAEPGRCEESMAVDVQEVHPDGQ